MRRTLYLGTGILAIAALIFLCVQIDAQSITPPTPLQATIIQNIGPLTIIDCSLVPACIDNRSQQYRQDNYFSFLANGTGTWSVQMQYADGTPASWTNFGTSGLVTNTTPGYGVGFGIGYHDFIRFVITGMATASYSAVKNFWSAGAGGGSGGVGPPGPTGSTGATGPTGSPNIYVTHTFTGTQELAFVHGLNTLTPIVACQQTGTTTGVSPGININTPATLNTTYITATGTTLTCAFNAAGVNGQPGATGPTGPAGSGGTAINLQGTLSDQSVTTPAGLLTLCATAVSTHQTLMLTQTWDLNGTCAADKYAYQGGGFAPSTGHVTTLLGSFNGTPTTHFSTAAGGTIIGPFVTPDGSMQASWWGIVPSSTIGAVVDQAALWRAMLSAMNAANQTAGNSTGQRTVQLASAGYYGIGSEVDVPENIAIVGGLVASVETPEMATTIVAMTSGISVFRNYATNHLNMWQGLFFQNASGVTSTVAIYLDHCVLCRVLSCWFANSDSNSFGLKGGNEIDFEVGHDVFSMTGTAMDFVEANSTIPGYFGIDIGSIHDNAISAGGGARIGGLNLTVATNDMESIINVNSGANTGSAILLCDPTANVDYSLDTDYWELAQGTASPARAIGVCPGSFRMHGGQMFNDGNINTGTVTTSGTSATLVSGGPFKTGWPSGILMTIAGNTYPISSCSSTTSCTFSVSVPTYTAQSYTMYSEGTGIGFIGSNNTPAYTYNSQIDGVSFSDWNIGVDFGTGFTLSLNPDSVVAANAFNAVTASVAGVAGSGNYLDQPNNTPLVNFFSQSIEIPPIGRVQRGHTTKSSSILYGASTTLINVGLSDLVYLGYNNDVVTITGLVPGSFTPFDGGFEVEAACTGCITLQNYASHAGVGFHLCSNRDTVLPLGFTTGFYIDGAGGVWEKGCGGSGGTSSIPTTVGALGSGQAKGTITPVTDGDGSSSTCTGGGSTFGLCFYTGSAWKSLY